MIVEDEVDVLRHKINASLLRAHSENKLPLEALTPLMTIARRLERVSDQAKNICEEVLYICTGESFKHQGAEVIRILFVDHDNACRSQIAEAVANSLAQPKLMFTSAGLDPMPVDPQAIKFLKEKGIDVPRAGSRSVQQVPNLEHYQVIIALDPDLKKSMPSMPNKVITLEWSVKDPSKVTGSPSAIQEAYEDAYRVIREHITDLSEAILGDEHD
jgi:arsenate reductase